MDKLILNLKKDIIEALNLDTTPDEIDLDDPLFGDGLGLDSIDALEIILVLEKYGIIVTEKDETKRIFASIRSLAEYVQENKK